MLRSAIVGNAKNSGHIQGICFLAIAATCFAVAGCKGGNDYGNRVAIAGQVLKNGEPLQGKATIVLDPEDKTSEAGKKAIGSMGEVRDGQFTIPEEMGPTPGQRYKVNVTTAPGIPAEGTPKDQIKLAERLTGSVEVPDKGSKELKIDVK